MAIISYGCPQVGIEPTSLRRISAERITTIRFGQFNYTHFLSKLSYEVIFFFRWNHALIPSGERSPLTLFSGSLVDSFTPNPDHFTFKSH